MGVARVFRFLSMHCLHIVDASGGEVCLDFTTTYEKEIVFKCLISYLSCKSSKQLNQSIEYIITWSLKQNLW